MVEKNKKNIDYPLIFLSAVQIIIFFSPQYIFIQPIILISFAFHSILNKSDNNIIYVITLLAGCDTYYRQVTISGYSTILPWEISKYLSTFICYVFYVYTKYRIRRKYNSFFNIFIFFCIPAMIISIYEATLSYTAIKGTISGCLSGLLSLYMVCKAFDGLVIGPKEFKKIIIYYFIGLLPTILFLISNLLNISIISFSTNSNFAFSGYGPIHISTALSFLVCLLFITNYNYHFYKYKKIIYLCSLFFIFIMILTFSRSGLTMFITSIFCSFIFIKKKSTVAVPLISFSIVFYLIVYPILNNVTYGAFEERFSEVRPDSRIELIKSDFNIWFDNIFFGVGLGLAKYNRDKLGEYHGKSHTEYSRFLSEQGLFGLLCLVTLFLVFLDRFKAEMGSIFLPLTAMLIVFPSLYFMVNAFSTFLPAYVFAISLIKLKN